MDSVIERARAKVNLTLHVGAPRSDGYHPLESVVMFARAGDVLAARKSDSFSLGIEGPFSAGLPAGDTNLILKVARAAGETYGASPCAFTLTKNLPVASGIGGGSADAAAALRAMARLDGKSPQAYAGVALTGGADVPVCMQSVTCVMRGIGDAVAPLPQTDIYPCVLVNPGVSVSTGDIFRRYDAQNPQDLQPGRYKADLIELALEGRNDLQAPACEAQPEIVRALLELACQSGVRLSRMSGSGATCFAVFDADDAARAAAAHIGAKYPAWWTVQTTLGGPV